MPLVLFQHDKHPTPPLTRSERLLYRAAPLVLVIGAIGVKAGVSLAPVVHSAYETWAKGPRSAPITTTRTAHVNTPPITRDSKTITVTFNNETPGFIDAAALLETRATAEGKTLSPADDEQVFSAVVNDFNFQFGGKGQPSPGDRVLIDKSDLPASMQ